MPCRMSNVQAVAGPSTEAAAVRIKAAAEQRMEADVGVEVVRAEVVGAEVAAVEVAAVEVALGAAMITPAEEGVAQ